VQGNIKVVDELSLMIDFCTEKYVKVQYGTQEDAMLWGELCGLNAALAIIIKGEQ
jgi:hypothetical protein